MSGEVLTNEIILYGYLQKRLKVSAIIMFFLMFMITIQIKGDILIKI
jgi:hypothetical protein